MNPSYFLPSGPSHYNSSSSSASASNSNSISPEPLHSAHYGQRQHPYQHSHPQQNHNHQHASVSERGQEEYPSVPLQTGPMIAPHQDLHSFLESFWTRQMDTVECETPDWKSYNLPLARIKKVMKSDEEVKVGFQSSTFRTATSSRGYEANVTLRIDDFSGR